MDLADGNWTLTVEAPEFETVTATQVMPPRIDSTGSYAYAYTAALEDEFVDEDEFGYTYLTRTIDLSLTLPDRVDAADYFLVRAQKTFNWEDFEEEEEAEFGGYVVLNPRVEDDPRIVWNQLCGGYLIQDIDAVEALNGLPFQLFQEAWGPEFDAVSAEPVVLEVCATFRRDGAVLRAPGFDRQPLWRAAVHGASAGIQQRQQWVRMLWALHEQHPPPYV